MQPDTSSRHSIAERIERLLPRIYVVVALLICLGLTVLTPPFFVPDEDYHAEREIELARGELMAHRAPDGAGAPMDMNLISVVRRLRQFEIAAAGFVQTHGTRANGRVTEDELDQVRPVGWSHRSTFSEFPNTAVYPPMLYLPAALGWKIAEAANLTIIHSLLLARLMATLCAVAIGWLALRLAGRERWLVFAFLLLPIDLSLSASCSQDALLAPLSALAVVLLFRAIREQRLQTMAELAATTAALTMCIAARPPYLPLALLLLLPTIELEQLRSRGMLPILAILFVFGVVGVWQLSVRPLGILLGTGASPALQMAFLKWHPLHGAHIIVSATIHDVPMLVLPGLDLLGTNNVLPSIRVGVFLLVCLFGVLVCSPQMRLRRWKSQLLIVGILLTIIGGISLVEYLIWTPPTATWLEGLQTRYYLPLFPAFLLTISGAVEAIRRFISPNLRRRSLVVVTALLLLIVAYTPWLAARRFYRASLPTALLDGIR